MFLAAAADFGTFCWQPGINALVCWEWVAGARVIAGVQIASARCEEIDLLELMNLLALFICDCQMLLVRSCYLFHFGVVEI